MYAIVVTGGKQYKVAKDQVLSVEKLNVQVGDQVALDAIMFSAGNVAPFEKSEFAAELTSEEINILAILMMQAWVQRQVTSIENVRMKYSGSDFKLTS